MLVILPYADFERSTAILNDPHLVQNFYNARQVLTTIEHIEIAVHRGTVANSDHPSIDIWFNYKELLKLLINTTYFECISRNISIPSSMYPPCFSYHTTIPWWFSCDRLFQSHRAYLLQHDTDFYKSVFPDEYKNNRYKSIALCWPDRLFSNKSYPAPISGG